jgi:20S proteasome alpha/beta subunit
MTLCVAIESANGIVLASDSRATFGDLRGLTTVNDTAVKIFKPNARTAVALSGQGETGNSLIQHISSHLAAKPTDSVDGVADAMRVVGNQMFTQWYGAPVWLVGPNGPMATPRPDVWYLLAGYTEKQEARIMSIASALPFNFAPNVCMTGFGVVGVVPLAIYLLNRLYQRNLKLDIAKDLAAYCILETASQDGKVGGPIRMAVVRADADTEVLTEAEVVELGKRVDAHREALKNSFLTLPKAQLKGASAAA